MKQPAVGIVMGSDSDWPVVEEASRLLNEFGVAHEVRVISAHRAPDAVAAYAKSAARRGLKVLISCAGGAAHLGGVLAAHTPLPVIGLPMPGGSLNGLDSLYATLQMPAGIPVATVTLGKAGPVNAAVFAVQILALANPELARKVVAYKAALERKVAEGDKRVQADIAAKRRA
ncbi:MAG: 5-(carboxyamino)imidazole ribonucleotide mutase [Lentisphaerae bacterium]|nr:5-(carboxyamino)imidazole ribonucleotide mutase [Lentisphaerota bacterium]